MKRLFLIVTVSFILPVVSFAETPRIALSVNLGPTFQALINVQGFGIGAVAEFAVLDSLSLAPQFSFATYHSALAGDVTQLSPCLQVRWYPVTPAVGGFWIGPRYQYSVITANGSGTPVMRGVSIFALDAGYKLLLNNCPGLFAEPYIGYGLAFDIETKGALDYGIMFGWAF